MLSLAQKIYTTEGISKEALFGNKKVLHIGCGKNKLPGAVGVDLLSLNGVDVVHNLDEYPWPFDNKSFDVLFAHNVVEHISSLPDLFNEINRVCKSGARVIITVPYFRSIDSFTDPTHKHFFTSNSLDYFVKTGGSLSDYSYISNKLTKINFWYGWPQPPKNLLVKMIKKIIHKNPKIYDQFISLLAPVKILVWELEVNGG